MSQHTSPAAGDSVVNERRAVESANLDLTSSLGSYWRAASDSLLNLPELQYPQTCCEDRN